MTKLDNVQLAQDAYSTFRNHLRVYTQVNITPSGSNGQWENLPPLIRNGWIEAVGRVVEEVLETVRTK